MAKHMLQLMNKKIMTILCSKKFAYKSGPLIYDLQNVLIFFSSFFMTTPLEMDILTTSQIYLIDILMQG